jgi:hypothetical protein
MVETTANNSKVQKYTSHIWVKIIISNSEINYFACIYLHVYLYNRTVNSCE